MLVLTWMDSYDEFDLFHKFMKKFIKSPSNVKDFMKEKWFEKGSSYPFIFAETHELLKKNLN